MMPLDAHARAPEPMKALFKRWQKSSIQDIEQSNEIINASNPADQVNLLEIELDTATHDDQVQVFREFLPQYSNCDSHTSKNKPGRFELKNLPGLFLYPRLLPRDIQVALLNNLLHRDLSNEFHKSNLHLHYEIPYSENESSSHPPAWNKSFFLAEQSKVLNPKDPAIHKPLTMKQVLERKLRWITLGGQYDWSAKVYPSEIPPQFPEDVGRLLKGLFPDVDAQAAIVNFYTPGDTLSVHRDVSEECDRGLISISIGCDGLFIIGNEDGSETATMRLRSGDVVLMTGQSRYAWHAVPKILANTCPDWLETWPADSSRLAFEAWRNWMSTKRINVNIRQMRA